MTISSEDLVQFRTANVRRVTRQLPLVDEGLQRRTHRDEPVVLHAREAFVDVVAEILEIDGELPVDVVEEKSLGNLLDLNLNSFGCHGRNSF